MNKPLILKKKEIEEQIVKMINESGIPIFILKNSIEKIYNQLISLEQKEFDTAKKEYENCLKKEGDKK